jgi:type II secretory pathway pseudopilin PulG
MSDQNLTPVAAVLSGNALSAVGSNALGTADTTGNKTAAFTLPKQRERVSAFTLAELLVSVGVLVVLVFLASQLLQGTATITTLGHKQMEADAQARQVLDRMAIDFAQMVKRSDVDYYVKSSWFASGTPPPPPGITPVPVLRAVLQPGNDQIAFYSSVPGYYPATGAQSPVSLVAYRVYNPSPAPSPCPDCNKLERLGKGLVWNAVSTTDKPVVFMPVPVASALPTTELPPSPTPTPSPSPAWPQAGNMATDAAYELVGPQVFRFEYYYLLKDGTFSDDPMLSPDYTLSGMQDVSAIVVDIAVIDPKSKVLLSDSQISQVASQLVDWGNATCAGCPTQSQWQRTPGLLNAKWRSAIDANTTGLPRLSVSGIRLYERVIYLSSPGGL